MEKIDTNFFKPFVTGTIKTLETQCETSAKPGKPFFKGDQAQPEFGIAGVIGVTSKVFLGSITLCFPDKVFLGLMSRMLGEELTELSDELEDGVAELLNIIFGQAKIVLNEDGYGLEKAIPTVVRGKNINTSHLTHEKIVVMPFIVDDGEFHIEIGVEPIASDG